MSLVQGGGEDVCHIRRGHEGVDCVCGAVLAGVLVWMLLAAVLCGKSAGADALLLALSQGSQFRQENQPIV